MRVNSQLLRQIGLFFSQLLYGCYQFLQVLAIVTDTHSIHHLLKSLGSVFDLKSYIPCHDQPNLQSLLLCSPFSCRMLTNFTCMLCVRWCILSCQMLCSQVQSSGWGFDSQSAHQMDGNELVLPTLIVSVWAILPQTDWQIKSRLVLPGALLKVIELRVRRQACISHRVQK